MSGFWFNKDAGLAMEHAVVDGVEYRRISGVRMWSRDNAWTFTTVPPQLYDPEAHRAAVEKVRAMPGPVTFEQMIAEKVWIPS